MGEAGRFGLPVKLQSRKIYIVLMRFVGLSVVETKQTHVEGVEKK